MARKKARKDHARTIEALRKQYPRLRPEELAPFLTILLNEAMLMQRQDFLGAKRYERSAQRRAYANGYKPKKLKLALGTLRLNVPKTSNHDVSFYPTVLANALLAERKLCLLMASMCVDGAAKPKIAKFLQILGLQNVRPDMADLLAQRLGRCIKAGTERKPGRRG